MSICVLATVQLQGGLLKFVRRSVGRSSFSSPFPLCSEGSEVHPNMCCPLHGGDNAKSNRQLDSQPNQCFTEEKHNLRTGACVGDWAHTVKLEWIKFRHHLQLNINRESSHLNFNNFGLFLAGVGDSSVCAFIDEGNRTPSILVMARTQDGRWASVKHNLIFSLVCIFYGQKRLLKINQLHTTTLKSIFFFNETSSIINMDRNCCFCYPNY